MNRVFPDIWNDLQGKKPQYAEFLERVTIRNIRGIAELTVPFTYPVSVLAGENCSGKSTVLFALACAYNDPEAGARARTPTTLFPDFRPSANSGLPSDLRDKKQAEMEYQYQTVGEAKRMRWRRTKAWSRSFFGQKGGDQPIRPVYIRTLSSVTNPSEARSHLTLARRSDVQSEEIDSSLVHFAEQILPFRYRRLVHLRAKGKRPLLFAEVAPGDGATGSGYSEFHMSSGERAVLELSLRLSKLKDALVLLDEVDMGLHPHTQQKLMLELQRLALRNDLQIVATTHSPTILDCVPKVARLFLERTSNGAVLRSAHRDIIQNALYGRAQEVLSVLCEDIVAENLIRGVMDVLCPEMDLRHSDVKIGRDTGADEFGRHLQMLEKFDRTREFLFVLDGDEAGQNQAKELRNKQSGLVDVLTLPGEAGPEEWIWRALGGAPTHYAEEFGLEEGAFSRILRNKEQMYNTTSGRPQEIAKNRLSSFCEEIGRESGQGREWVKGAIAHVARVVGRRETEINKGDMAKFKADMMDAVGNWRRVV